MTKQQENRAFVKMLKEFPKAFGRVSFRERLMLRTAFSYVVEEVVADIETENAELKAKNKWYSEQVCNKECAEVWGNLTKAKEIIRDLLGCLYSVEYDRVSDLEQAEQFIKENE